MPVIPELQALVDALGEHDRSYQERAVRELLYILNRAEDDIADSMLTREARRDLANERFFATVERSWGKAIADELRAGRERIMRGQSDE
jgi:hypothetical protein